MSYFPFEWKLFIRNKKNIFLFAAMFLYFVSFPVIYQFQFDRDIEAVKKEELGAVDIALFPFTPEYIEQDPEFNQSYENLMNQRKLLVSQLVSLTMKQDEQYLQQELALINLRFDLINHEMAGIDPSFSYDLIELNQSFVEVNYLIENGLTLNKTILNDVDVLIKALSLFAGYIFPLIVTFLAMDSYLSIREHPSIMKSLPITQNKALGIKYLLYMMPLLLMLSVSVGSSWLIGKSLFSSGNLAYPKVIFSKGQFLSISSSEYIVSLLLGLVLMASFIVLLSFLLNKLFSNAYVNLIGLIAIIFLPVVVELLKQPALIKYFSILHVAEALSGEKALAYGFNNLTYENGLIIILIMSLIVLGLILFISRTFKRS